MNDADISALISDGETAVELRRQRDRLASVYEEIRQTLHAAKLRGSDLILLSHPVKAPFLEMYDSLGAMANEIAEGKWRS